MDIKTTRQNMIDLYLEFVNDYLTVEKFAEHKRITTEQADLLITIGKEIHEDYESKLYRVIEQQKRLK